MKNIRLFFLMGIVLFMGEQSLFAQSKKEKQEQRELEVKELIESKRFTIDVDRAIPMGGQSVNLTSPYSLEMRGDSVISYLPYFGRAYSAPYGGGNGLHFNQSITGYTCTFGKKGKTHIHFATRTDDDIYRFDIQVFSNGSATIAVMPARKQSITFQGEVALPAKEK